MGRRQIFTVGFELPGEEFEYVKFESDQTLLDADIVLFEPTLGDYTTARMYNGKAVLGEHSSFRTTEQLGHWRAEIASAVDAGKLVIAFLVKPIDCYRDTGQKEFSGTGRSRVTTNLVTAVSSYEAIPYPLSVSSKSGKEVRLDKGATYLAQYWSEFSDICPYEVELAGDLAHVLLRSRVGSRVVGAAFPGATGTLLLLPPLRYDDTKFTRYDGRSKKSYWTAEAVQFGKRLVSALAALADSLADSIEVTPAPSWCLGSSFRLAEEGRVEVAISACTRQIARQQAKKALLELRRRQAGSLRGLLFEQGHALERSILEALALMGFEGATYSDGDSEFDAVLVSPEGRCLGEAEGKDNRSINIDKFSQLERNLGEDFARDGVEQYAKGVLFGNAYRLLPLADREAFFTAKCISAAKRVGVALVRTTDLFDPSRYLKENPSDTAYAKQCREAIFRSDGDIVAFPSPPGELAPSASEVPTPVDLPNPGGESPEN